MVALGPPRRDNLSPALVAAAFLHVGAFFLAGLLAPSPPLALGDAVPVTIVSRAPSTDSAPAIQAPAPQPAATNQPAERANPVPAAAPVPAPPKARPAPVARSASVAPTPAPASKAPPARPTLNLDALAASVAKVAAADRAKAGRAPPGPTRSRAASEVRVDAGQGVSQSDMQGLQQLLERLWNPNCSVEGADAVVVPIKFQIDENGRLIGRVSGAAGSASDPVSAAAARRAIDAVHQAEPYAAPYRGKSFTVIFDAQKACAGR